MDNQSHSYNDLTNTTTSSKSDQLDQNYAIFYFKFKDLNFCT